MKKYMVNSEGIMGEQGIAGKNKDYFYDLIKDQKIPEITPQIEFAYLIFLPTMRNINNRYKLMRFILFDKNGLPIAKNFKSANSLISYDRGGNWIIDCLPCGLLRFSFFGYGGRVVWSDNNGLRIESVE